MVNILQAAVAVMAGGDQDFGPPGLGRKKLFGLDAVAIHAGVLEGRATVDYATAGPAAIIMLTVGMHLDKLFTDGIDDVAGFFCQPPSANDVTRIMKGDRLGIFFRNFYLIFPQQLIVKVYGMDDGYGGHPPPQPAVAHIIN